MRTNCGLFVALLALLTPHTPHSKLYTLHSTLRALHFTLRLYTPHFHTVHSTLYIHSTLCTPHFILLYTSHFTLDTPHSTLSTPHSTLCTPHSTLYTFHFTLHTLRCALYTPYSILYTLHSTLCPPHFTLHTLHLTRHAQPHSTSRSKSTKFSYPTNPFLTSPEPVRGHGRACRPCPRWPQKSAVRPRRLGRSQPPNEAPSCLGAEDATQKAGLLRHRGGKGVGMGCLSG